MIQGKVLVTGATGDTGRATVDELLARGHRVRALAHGQDERSKKLQDCGVEVVYGDLLDFGQVKAALNGVKRAYFVYPIRPGILQATAYFAQAAKEAGVDGIVNMSQISAREDAKSHAATDHWLAERVFDWSGSLSGRVVWMPRHRYRSQSAFHRCGHDAHRAVRLEGEHGLSSSGRPESSLR